MDKYQFSTIFIILSIKQKIIVLKKIINNLKQKIISNISLSYLNNFFWNKNKKVLLNNFLYFSLTIYFNLYHIYIISINSYYYLHKIKLRKSFSKCTIDHSKVAFKNWKSFFFFNTKKKDGYLLGGDWGIVENDLTISPHAFKWLELKYI